MSGETEDSVSGWTTDTLREHLNRSLAAERSYIDGKVETVLQRFADMDRAIALLSETINRTPTDLQKAVSDLLRLMDERDRRVGDQFEAIRQLRESQYNLSQQQIKDALIAQKESTGVSYSSLDRTIEKNAQIAAQGTDNLGARVGQLQDQVNVNQRQIAEILASKAAVVEQRVDTRGSFGTVGLVVGSLVGILGLVIAAVSLIISTR